VTRTRRRGEVGGVALDEQEVKLAAKKALCAAARRHDQQNAVGLNPANFVLRRVIIVVRVEVENLFFQESP